MATSKKQLQYFLIPHPDDEFESWSLVQQSPDNYPVFILLTRGERTVYADGHGLQADLGERVPQPQPFRGAMSEACRAQRVDSWHAFLDAMAAKDPTLDVPASVGHFAPDNGPARGFDLWVGDQTTRVVFDLGDSTLRPDDVTRALQTVRSLRGTQLPLSDEYGAVAAGYYNAADPQSFHYIHPDHHAVHVALFTVDQGLPGPQWGRTSTNDPDAATAGRVEEVDPAIYEYAMAVDADGTRRGVLQQCYGWLTDGTWAASEVDDITQFSRRQTFWQRF